MKESNPDHGNIEEIDAGDSLFSWSTWEYPPHERSRRWYLVAGILAIFFIVYSIYTENFLFAVIILMMGVLVLVTGLRRPDRIDVHVTTLGLVIGSDFHSYKEIKDFSIIYEPPDVKLLYVDFESRLHPMVAVPLEEADPNMLREALLPYVFENIDRESEGLTELFRRVYKI